MKKTYTGSCHCGKIRYEVDADLQAGTGRCNCTVCGKRRYWGAVVKPEDFRLLCEETAAADYQFATMSGHHRFCPTCGLHAYGHGQIPEIGGDYVSINIACLDDISPEELAALPVRYMDGRHDNWWNEPAVTSYL
ncbi:aldehyde-activating protein [Rhizobium sp. R72]|uniref:GFA family protein n=1 Tax=unclassified Rhizobium TaxID=2613769 RepID=UPI000B52ABDF|nr:MULTISPECIES: GFA family protein [unclassified Rhizobium]OWV96701.1 aldehyde-activating protein [Rhizobium sp. R693]OWW05289.1 aldehyde-activating protein [Rhizobium sp. R72]OWW06346.1 aldehyde-activating protein [Rhizobium sp. R711]